MLEDDAEVLAKDDTHYIAAARAQGGFPVANADAGRAQLADRRAEALASGSQRAIRAISVAGVTPGAVSKALPTFAVVDPATLLVAESYQRHLSERGLQLIRKIVATWDWRRFKPPVVARTALGLEIIDGQHTAIAAASHPAIGRIPVMVVDAAVQAERASAFIGHNKDRLGMTPMQLHFAAVAAGEPAAVAIGRAAEAAGVRILRSTPGNGLWKARETVAVNAIGQLLARRGEESATMVLKALADADCTPISAAQLKAADMLLHDEEYRDQITAEQVTRALQAMGDEADQEAKVFAAAHSVPLWRALVVVIGRNRRRRKAAA